MPLSKSGETIKMNKRLSVILVLLILILIAYSQRGSIAERIMAMGIEAVISTDVIGELGDGLHVALCGAGGPLPDIKRSGACVAVIAGDKMFVVDAGTNGLRNLNRMRYNPGQISHVLLTHFHSDHIDGLGEMATIRWVGGNHTDKLPVIGPEGVDEVVAGFNQSYQQDSVYRNDHHGDAVAPLSGHGMIAQSFDLPQEGELTAVYEQDGLKIEMLAVDHEPVKPAVAYLFSYQGRTVLVSGDTAKSANLQQFAQGVDLLVHEALAPNLVNIMNAAAEKTGNASMAKITHDILDYHASPVEAAEIARDAEVGHLLYYHIVPPLILPGMEAAWLEGVDDVYTDYTMGQDGTAFTLPPNSDEIILTSKGL
jgi:ribonuclease Z